MKNLKTVCQGNNHLPLLTATGAVERCNARDSRKVARSLHSQVSPSLTSADSSKARMAHFTNLLVTLRSSDSFHEVFQRVNVGMGQQWQPQYQRCTGARLSLGELGILRPDHDEEVVRKR